ncbi:MAG: hypothetical protein KIT84_07825 [Labilithrix sp.]|nr:hypothetical protein [Labilithrix sp.]MCW5810905.1 hypothetical protein [Labilithrix sp.]
MKLVKKMVLGGLFALAMTAASGNASAAPNRGLLIDTAVLAPSASVTLRSDIDRAKLKSLAAFNAVNEIAIHADDLDKQSRRPGLPLTNAFKALGPEALMPMLELLAVDNHVPATTSASARKALETGLVEAVGLLKDPKALPVLTSILAKSKDLTMTFVTADAIAKLGSDDAVSALTSSLKGADATRSREILRGLGSAHRLAATQTIAGALDAHPDADTAAVLARALGHSANAWAWKAKKGGAEEAPSRDAAARSLMKAYLGYEGEARNAALKALLVVDASSTMSLINNARKGATPAQTAALDDLASRFASNPAR